MIKKFVFIFALFGVLIFPVSVSATAPIDQMCGSFTDSPYFDISQVDAFQIFVPTKNTVDAVGMFLFANDDQVAKITATIYNISSIWDYRIVVQKTVVIDDVNGYKVIDLPDSPMPAGRYAIGLKSVHSTDSATWLATHYNCYPNGNAIIDDENHPELDFGFTVYAYDTQSPATEPDPPAEEPSTNQPESSDEESSSGAIAISPDLPKTTASGSDKVQSFEKAPVVDNDANKSAGSITPMSDEELVALISWIKEEQERIRPRGIFGLGGVLGRILTWPVVIGFGVFLFLIILVIVIISLSKRRKSTQSSESLSND